MNTSLPIFRRVQRGLTLVEFLVAIVLMMMVTAATVALYSVNSGSNRTVDASQTLDDTARFVFEIVGQAVRNAGYPGAVPVEPDVDLSRRTVVNLFEMCAADAGTKPCPILGFDNSKVGTLNGAVGGKNSGGINNSDSLAIRFNGASNTAKDRTLGKGNESLTTCGGNDVAFTDDETQLGLSVFWVKNKLGEPELYCNEEYYQWKSPGQGWKRSSQPMARGVESFQVMYGVDCQVASPTTCPGDGVPDRWVVASDVGAGDWRNVRAVRIGLVLRGPPGSAQSQPTEDFYPLGKEFLTSTYRNTAGMKFTAPNDGRLRRVYSATFMLRNSF